MTKAEVEVLCSVSFYCNQHGWDSENFKRKVVIWHFLGLLSSWCCRFRTLWVLDVVANRGNKLAVCGCCWPDGVKKRFAPGTKAAFAVERFNCQLRDPALPVVCIVAYKDGEDPIEFGPDVELVVYDESWTLKTLREGTGGIFNPGSHARMCSLSLNRFHVISFALQLSLIWTYACTVVMLSSFPQF